MRRILTTRRAEWLPGLAVFGSALGIGVLLGSSLGRGAWLLAAALAAGALAGFTGLRWLRGRKCEPLAKPRAGFRGLTGRKPPGYDLANDESTKKQRYLM